MVLLNDIEDGEFAKIASGFFTISDNLPIDSKLNFTFTLSESEVLSAKVRVEKSGETKEIVLGRGNKDSKCLATISESIRSVINNDAISDAKKAEYMSKVQENIDIISNGNFEEDASEWQDIENKISLAQNMALTREPEEDSNSISLIIAKILLGTFGKYINTEDENEMNSLIPKAESSTNPMERVVALKKLETIGEKYSLFTTIFMFKIVAMSEDHSTGVGTGGKEPLLVRADRVFNEIMLALDRHDIDTVRSLIANNTDILNKTSGPIDISTAIRS